MADPFSFAIMTVAQIGISFLFPAEGPRLKDLKMSASTYGAAIPEAYGYARVAANMIWADKIREHKKKKTVGLKSYKYYLYTCTFAMALCRGPISQVRRIWANYKLIYDATGQSEVQIKKKFKIRTYLGTEDQTPNASIEKIQGEGNTPAYRGLAYIVFEDMPLEDFGNTIPQISVEVFATGEAQTTATATLMTALPNSSGLGRGGQLVDPDRGYAYYIGSGIRRYHLGSMREDFQATDASIADASDFGGVSPLTGNVFVYHGISNSVPLTMHEPFGLAEIGRVGTYGSGFGTPPGERGVFSYDSAMNEFLMCENIFGDWMIYPTAENKFTTANMRTVDGSNFGLFGRSVKVGMRGSGAPTFYCWDGESATGVYIPWLALWLVTTLDGGNTWTKIEAFRHPNPLPEEPGIHIDFQIVGAWLDASDNNLLLAWREKGRTQLGKLSTTSYDWLWRKDVDGKGDLGRTQSTVVSRNEFWWVGTNRLYIVDTMTGEYRAEFRDPYADYDDPTDIPKDVAAPPAADYNGIPITPSLGIGAYFFDETRNIVVSESGPRVVRPGVGPVEDNTLAGFVERLLRRAGLTSRNFDLSGLSSQKVRGYAWASATDVRSVLDQMRRVFAFDLLERNGKIVGVMRGDGSNEFRPGKPVRRIQQKVLGNSSNDTDGMDYWQETRLQESDLPAKVLLSYMNWDDDFATSTAVSRRMSNPNPTMFSRQQVAMEIAVVMTGTEAKNQVNKILWAQWGERMKHSTRLPWAYMDLDPADTVTVTMDDGRQYIERVHAMEIGADFGIATETYAQDSASYVSNAVGDGGGRGGSDGIVGERPAKPFIFNTPLLRDQDETGGSYSLYYTGVGNGTPEDFAGAGLYRSTDNLTYDMLYGTDLDVEWGQVSGVVPDASHGHFALDWETRITIWPVTPWFELESITDDELWEGANLCIVGNEVMQFRDAVQNANGSWTIRNLLRGRRGTEYATSTHKVGETFVFLSSTTVTPEGELLDVRGQSRFFRAVAEGLSLESAPPATLKYEPRDLMPYAPKDIRRTFAGTTCTLDWSRRTRTGGNMQDGTGVVPLNETGETYEVYICSTAFADDLSRSDSIPTDVIFSATTTAPTLTFDVSGMTAPFDVNLDTLHVVIYQNSAAVGRGFPGVRSIPPWQDF